jgi:hypothetical protein
MQLIVDIQLVAMLVYWFLRADSFRYAIVMACIGLSKILLNVNSKNYIDSFPNTTNTPQLQLTSLPLPRLRPQLQKHLFLQRSYLPPHGKSPLAPLTKIPSSILPPTLLNDLHLLHPPLNPSKLLHGYNNSSNLRPFHFLLHKRTQT